MKKIEKSFPANRELDIKTFLNDPKIDGELYAYLLTLSKGIQGQTILYKKDLPNQTIIAETLHYKSRQTVGSHMKYLKERGYIQETNDSFILLNPEKYYFNIPLETLQYLVDTVKELVIKTYIYLGVCNNTSPKNYTFTLKELCEHLGSSYTNTAGRDRIKNCLDILKKLNLIDFIILFDEKKLPYFKLINFTTSCPLSDDVKKIC